MRYAAYLLILALAACQQRCPERVAVKEWTPEEQREILAEEEKLGEDWILIGVLEDYARLRRGVR